ncbi:hypothetical protein FACS1894167_03680 [Synergistales bacterium]|nr:hypothetical protein FACS1894167_03680 [Synergistales bacterium]GHV51943.1 hypothetical protein FACS1894216_07170 [Synergistales bacterium]
MISVSELRDAPDTRRLLYIFGAAFVMWLIVIALAIQLTGSAGDISRSVIDGGQIIRSGAAYRAALSGGAVVSESGENTLGSATSITDALGLRDRVRQLQSNSAGVSIQIDGLYGSEANSLIDEFEKKGVRIKTAEIKSLVNKDGTTLSATFLLE